MKKIFALLVSCVLLLVAVVGYASVPYGAYRYVYDKNDTMHILKLFYTPEGVFASVNVSGVSDMFPWLEGTGRVQNATLSLENYLIERTPGERLEARQLLDCEAEIKHKKRVVLRPTIDARELGVTTISDPDIAGCYKFEPGEMGADERLALVYLHAPSEIAEGARHGEAAPWRSCTVTPSICPKVLTLILKRRQAFRL